MTISFTPRFLYSLAGPRRVGKSTFLMEDLIPEAEDRHCVPVYVDLWANKLADPAMLITEAVKKSGVRSPYVMRTPPILAKERLTEIIVGQIGVISKGYSPRYISIGLGVD